MKRKNFLMLILGITAQTCFAQIKVSNDGHVGIGVNYTTPSLLNVGGYGSSLHTFSLVSATGKRGMYIQNNAVTTGETEGLVIKNFYYPGNYTYGIRVYPYASSSAGYTYAPTYSISGRGGGSTSINYGVVGDISTSYSAPKGAGIYGSSTILNQIDRTGVFAGYFYGDVVVTGTTYANLLTPLTSSSSRQQTSLSEESLGESVTSKIAGLQSVRIYDDSELKPQRVSESDILKAREDDEEISEEVLPIQTRMSEIRYSIDEASLREVFPELVYEDKDGNISINYIEIIPLLVQSIKELNSQITELKGTKERKQMPFATSIANESTEIYSLSQNNPNPFTDKTEINLSLPQSVKKAYIFIYNMEGKQLKQIEVLGRGDTNISITSEGLDTGMYLYSLIADGKIINTKRMILTK